jgi:hypothetical protein
MSSRIRSTTPWRRVVRCTIRARVQPCVCSASWCCVVRSWRGAWPRALLLDRSGENESDDARGSSSVAYYSVQLPNTLSSL